VKPTPLPEPGLDGWSPFWKTMVILGIIGGGILTGRWGWDGYFIQIGALFGFVVVFVLKLLSDLFLG
jgi:hypothetical protein